MISTKFNAKLRYAVLLALGIAANPAHAVFQVQCPGDTNTTVNGGDATWNSPGEVRPDPNGAAPGTTKCMHLTGGDAFVKMADGTVMYSFGFANLTGIASLPANNNLIQSNGLFAAQWPSPTIALDEGDRFYLTLSNIGMTLRPDLFDPHSVHFHGFPNASAYFDGEPESTFGVNMGASTTYFYNVREPGTYMYHCHVEAAEHMQMGMLGNLYVHPAQNGQNFGGFSNFVFNDGDGSTGYSTGMEFPLQLGSADSKFRESNYKVQLAPGVYVFARMKDDYAQINGRGYPDTVTPIDNPDISNMMPQVAKLPAGGPAPAQANVKITQKMGSKVVANAGQKILLRLSSLSVTAFYTVTASGLPLQVVGQGAKILRGAGELTGPDLYYKTSSVTLGGGEANEILVDTTGIASGTYFLYTTNLNSLSNGNEDNGGMMTEIQIL